MNTFTVETIEAQHAAVVRGEAPMTELKGVFDRGFGESMRVISEQGATITDAPFGYYPRMPGETVEVLVGFPVAEPITPDGDVTSFELPGGRAVVGLHVGDYESLASTYADLQTWAANEGLVLGVRMWETYLTDPSAEPDPSKWQTRITWMLA
jgi:effector-binding domain-containing protein